MMAIIATIRIKPGTEQEFEAEAKVLAAKVAASEPGCTLYTLCRSETPHTYVMLERYVDRAAIDFHRGTSHYKEVGGKIARFAAAPVGVQVLTEV
jgi:quinol monooxygenase YgiN